MSQYKGKCISVFGTSGIQRYLFHSNRLKENAGGSELVRQAIEEEAPRGGQLVFAGGGNAVIVFPTETAAKNFTRKWSLDWLTRAPGLRLIAAHQEIQDSVREAYREAHDKLFLVEERPRFGSEPGALPGVRECPSTGLAANGRENPKDSTSPWLSEEAIAKQRAGDNVHNQHNEIYADILGTNYRFPKELSDLGQKKGESQIAVVHIDGDGVGTLFKEVAADQSSDGEIFLKHLWLASEVIKKIALRSRRAMLRHLVNLQKRELVPTTKGPKKDSQFVGLRFLVTSGDDLTFVCQGRIGLMLAALYIRYWQHFASKSWDDRLPEPKPTCSGGVLIMPEKFPFARAYQLAKQLATNAKSKKKKYENEPSVPGYGWLDFQVVLEGVTESLESLPGEHYKRSALSNATADAKPKNSLRRAYRVAPGIETESYDWERFHRLWRHFHKWPGSRSHQLLDALARGDQAVEQTKVALSASGIVLPAEENERWTNSPDWWDPLEMLEFHNEGEWGSGLEEKIIHDEIQADAP